MTSHRSRSWRRRLAPLKRLAQDYSYVHTTLGLVGNTMFFVGSVFFLVESLKRVAIWLFILGSLGMLIDTVGSALLKAEGYDPA